MNQLAGLGMILLIEGVCPGMAWAAESDKTGTLSFVLENDVFCREDRHYTSGLKVNWVPGQDASAPEWAVKAARLAPWFPEQGEIRHGYAFGQSAFTPSDIEISDPPLEERPYAGWLYGAIALGVESERQLDLFELSIGVVGPAALAEEGHKLVHRAVGVDEPQGWHTQLGNEPGLVLTYQRSWRGLATSILPGPQLDLTPHVGAALGNVFTYANAGVTVRYGKRLPRDYGPPRVQPAIPAFGDYSPASDFGWFLFAGIEGRAIARNIFLDGNTFRDSRSVDKEPLVGDFQFGFALDWPAVRFSYTHVVRTREFRTQNEIDQFGSLNVSLKY